MTRPILYAVAAVLLAAALACSCKVRSSGTRGGAAPWLALTGAACLGAMYAAVLAGGSL